MSLDIAQGVLLRLKFEPDLRLHYLVQTEVAQEVINKGVVAGRTQQKWETRVWQRVLRVEADGSAHLVTVSEPQVEPGKVQVPGVTLQRQVVYSFMDTRGHLLEIAGASPGSTYSFPDHPVAAGQAWEGKSELVVPGMSEPVVGSNHYVLVGSEDLNDIPCVKIQMKASEITFEMPLPDGRNKARVLLESEGWLYFAPLEGMLVRMEMKTHSIPKIQDVIFDTVTLMVQQLDGVERPGA
ncbi:MAG TPA: hypothetical protein VNO81_05490 [Candidatus Nitrosotenuis sp.]|nr:hypothetical protein [Candidatus Nitrosotenuis sp.]